MTQRQPEPAPGAAPERGFVLAVLAPGVAADEALAEIPGLARTAAGEPGEAGGLARPAGGEPIGDLVQRRPHPAPRTYVGKGKVEELKTAYAASGAESLLVDDELDPAQQRFLENALETRVIDRTQLILDIFAQHAVTADGKLQV